MSAMKDLSWAINSSRTIVSVNASFAPFRYDLVPPTSISASAASIAIRRFAILFSSGDSLVQVSGKSGGTTTTRIPTSTVMLHSTSHSEARTKSRCDFKDTYAPSIMYNHLHALMPLAPSSPLRMPAAIKLPNAPEIKEPEKKIDMRRLSSFFVYHLER